MASIQKYTMPRVSQLLRHNNRTMGDGVTHNNEGIDDSRTCENYHLKKGGIEEAKQRLQEVFFYKKENLIALAEVIVTLPSDVKPEDEKKFFQAVLEFYCQDFGERNIINAVVHKDEVTPHIHIDFIPVTSQKKEYHGKRYGEKIRQAFEDWKATHPENLERLNAFEVITKEYLKKMHPRLSVFVEEQLGYPTAIQNGATENGNKSILKLKVETLQRQLQEGERKKKFLNDDIQRLINLKKKCKITDDELELSPLLQKLYQYQQQVEVLQEIIARNQIAYSQEDLKKMQADKMIPSHTVKMNFHEGALEDVRLEEDAVIVLEIFHKNFRKLPQEKILKQNHVFELMKMARVENPMVSVKESKANHQIYIFVKTDNESQTISGLLELEKVLYEMERTVLKNRKLYMEHFETDRFHLGKQILSQLEADAHYFMRADKYIEEQKKVIEYHENQKGELIS